MAIFSNVFGAEQRLAHSHSSIEQRAHPQPRALAQELCLAACLMPLMASNITAEVLPEIFASDSSLKRGAYRSAPVAPPVAKALWASGKVPARGYTGPSAFLRAAGKSTYSEDVAPAPFFYSGLDRDLWRLRLGLSRGQEAWFAGQPTDQYLHVEALQHP